MKGARPRNPGTGDGERGKGITRPPNHDLGSTSSKCEEQDPARIRTGSNEMRDTVREGGGFARACPGDDKERGRRRGSGRELRRVQHEAPNICRRACRRAQPCTSPQLWLIEMPAAPAGERSAGVTRWDT